jgi:hypothetical protein
VWHPAIIGYTAERRAPGHPNAKFWGDAMRANDLSDFTAH